jgi:tetratricopeptide (TPR) repeat protein
MARTSSFAFADSDMTIPRISGLLGVRYLLQGSVRRDLDQVRITAQLVDNSGLQVWSQSFDRKLEGIFVIQTEIANAVARQLVAQVVPRALNDARTTTSMDAYQEYLVGREYLYTRSPGWTRNAATAFRHAIELDGGYAPAYAGLAVATQLGGPDSRDEIESNRKSARAYAVKALALDPDLAEAHAALGLINLDGPDADALAAETSLRRAIELDPTVSNAYNWLANALLAQNKRAEARLVRQQGLQSDPLNPIMNVNLANQYLNVGDFERAESLLLRLLDLPSPPEHAYGSLFELYANYGRMIDALHILIRGEQAGDVPDSSEFFYGIADFLQVLGLRNDADYWYARGSDIDPIPTRILIRKARMLKVYGDYDELRTLLDDAYQNNRINEAAIPYSAREVLVPIKVFAGDYVGGISTAESVIDIENLPRTDGEPSIGTIDLLHALAYGYRMAGLPQKADAILDYLQALFQEMQQQGTVGNPLMAAQQALNHAMRNDMAAAEAALADAVDAGWRNYWYVANDPRWQELLELPGVAPIIAKVTADLELQAREVEVILTNLDL